MPSYATVKALAENFMVKEGPWGVASLAISQAQVAMKLGVNDATTGSNQNTAIVAPYTGTIVGIAYQLNTNKTAGALSCSPTIGGTEVASTHPLYRVAMGNAVQVVQKLSDGSAAGSRFVVGNLLGVKVTTDGSFAPAASADILAWLLVVYEGAQP